MEKSLKTWLIEQTQQNLPVTGEMVKFKTIQLHQRLIRGNETFSASDGWLQNFKTRHGLRILKISGEKLSSAVENVSHFKAEVSQLINRLNLTQIKYITPMFHVFYWQLLPSKCLRYSQAHFFDNQQDKVTKMVQTFSQSVNL